MIKIDKESLLKNTPDYEDYTENEAVLTKEEMEEFGIESNQKGGCCKTKGGSSSGGCGSTGGCCKK